MNPLDIENVEIEIYVGINPNILKKWYIVAYKSKTTTYKKRGL